MEIIDSIKDYTLCYYDSHIIFDSIVRISVIIIFFQNPFAPCPKCPTSVMIAYTITIRERKEEVKTNLSC